jgi:D-alanine transaminase
MFRIAYVNGRYVRTDEAAVHVEDRGYQFADGVYEVVAVANGTLVDEVPHLARLERSLRELEIAWPVSQRALRHIIREVVRRNGLIDGMIYLQITRGVAPRDHAFPTNARPALVVTAKRLAPQRPELAERGVDVISIPDQRWRRCDIKSVSLLPNVLGKQHAVEAGAYEAWQVDGEGMVTEGTSTNAWIVTAAGVLVTRPASAAILNGVTRLALARLLATDGIGWAERPFSVGEARAAREAFLTGTSAAVLPVTRIDGQRVGDGKPGPITRKLREHYLAALGTDP